MNKYEIHRLEVGAYVYIRGNSKYRGEEAVILNVGPVIKNRHCYVDLLILNGRIKHTVSSIVLFGVHHFNTNDDIPEVFVTDKLKVSY